MVQFYEQMQASLFRATVCGSAACATAKRARVSQVTVFQHGVSGNKEPFVDISDEMIYTALQVPPAGRLGALRLERRAAGWHGHAVGTRRARGGWSRSAGAGRRARSVYKS